MHTFVARLKFVASLWGWLPKDDRRNRKNPLAAREKFLLRYFPN